MNRVVVAESAGFCFGVDRAVKMVYNELQKNTKVATFGAIIHNQDVVSDMESKGARVIGSVDELLEGETVVIRSHGVGKDIYDQISRKGNRMLDATCPFVAKIHKIVAEMTEKGYLILIAGDVNHPEVQGIIGHCKQNFIVFKDKIELNHVFEKNPDFFSKRLAFVAQTTYNIIEWQECIKMIPDAPDIVVFNTICNATDKRQTDAAELAANSDVMLVIGGKHSSNTVKLSEVCSRYCKTYHIENADELSSLNLPCAGRIGITAGASTPAYIIKEVQTTMTENVNLNANQEENVDFAKLVDDSFKKIHNGEKVKGIVMSVDNAEITVDLGIKQTGYVKIDELTDDTTKKPDEIVSVGDEIELIVIKVSDGDGTVLLSKKKVDELAGYDTIVKAYEEGTVLEGKVSRAVNKGVIINYLGVRIFVPASQTGLPRDAELEQLSGKKVEFKIIDIEDGNKKKAVGSIRAVSAAKREEARNAFWSDVEIGKTYTGRVKSLTNFGAFVDLGGIDGMVHISELSWKRIKHPSEVVSVGDSIEVYIKDFNKDENRISLGYKKAEDDPWNVFVSNYSVGDVVEATIVSITSFGAFARIVDDIDGLIHISQIADKKVENVKDILSVGDVVTVKIIEIDSEKKRISISIRALLEKEEATAEETDAE